MSADVTSVGTKNSGSQMTAAGIKLLAVLAGVALLLLLVPPMLLPTRGNIDSRLPTPPLGLLTAGGTAAVTELVVSPRVDVAPDTTDAAILGAEGSGVCADGTDAEAAELFVADAA